MPDFRPFGASNAPETCLCGRKLKRSQIYEGQITRNERGETRYWQEGTGRFTLGTQNDGFFCGLRCAHAFAVGMAKLGRRFAAKDRME